MPWSLWNVMCNVIFKFFQHLGAFFHPLSSSRTLYNWYPFRRSLKASPAIDELATPFLKRSEACKKSLKKGKVKNKERGRSSKLAWIRGEVDGLRGEGERQTVYVGRGRGRRVMWGRGSVENMYRKGRGRRFTSGRGQVDSVGEQVMVDWNSLGGWGDAGCSPCWLSLSLSLSLSLFLKGKGEWRGISLRKEGKKQTVYMGRGWFRIKGDSIYFERRGRKPRTWKGERRVTYVGKGRDRRLGGSWRGIPQRWEKRQRQTHWREREIESPHQCSGHKPGLKWLLGRGSFNSSLDL